MILCDENGQLQSTIFIIRNGSYTKWSILLLVHDNQLLIKYSIIKNRKHIKYISLTKHCYYMTFYSYIVSYILATYLKEKIDMYHYNDKLNLNCKPNEIKL